MMEKNVDPLSGPENSTLVCHFSFGENGKLNRWPYWLQRLFSKTLQSVLNKGGGFRRKLRASACLILATNALAAAYAAPAAVELKFPQSAVGEIRIRNRPPEGDIEPDQLIEELPARG